MDAEIMERVQNFCLMDDIFFNAFMKDNVEGMEYVLNIIMNRTDLKVQSLETQYDIPGIIARGVRFDVFCTDADGNEYDFEVQNDSDGASPLRGRYNSSMMDYIHFSRGADWRQLPRVFVIFFTRDDVRRKNRPLSRVSRKWDDDGEEFGDRTELIYVNGAYRDITTALGRLISDFHCANPADMHSEVLAKRAGFLKSDKEEVSRMTDWVEEYANRKATEGVFNRSVEYVKLMMEKLNISAEKALEVLEIPKDDFPKYLAAL